MEAESLYNEEADRFLNRMLARLDASRKQHGHSAVPPSHDPDLWRWIHHQRRSLVVSQMKPRRRRGLDAGGILWERADPRWEEKFVRLREFHRQHGHTRVLYSFPDDPPLGRWVSQQRTAFRDGRLSEERRRRLDEVGPGWKVGDQRRVAG